MSPYYNLPNFLTPYVAPGGGGGSTRGLVGGSGSGTSNIIDYIDITSLGNATDFGDLDVGRYFVSALGSATRGVFSGGYTGSVVDPTMDYVTFATTGNATTFGEGTANLGSSRCCISNSTRGINSGGRNTSFSDTNVIDYITIATESDATDFGDTTVNPTIGAAGTSSTTRGIASGGSPSGTGSSHNVIEYVTISTTGNATDFGDLTAARIYCAGAWNSTRSCVGGGGNATTNIIDYTTISTTGNAIDFGDLTASRANMCGTASDDRGVFFGGGGNVIDYIDITSLGNASDFGDLTRNSQNSGACSGNHGGIA